MTLFLVYGKDSSGKTVQLKNICENHAQSPLYISLEPKDRELFKDATFPVEEPLVINDDNTIDKIESFNKLGLLIEKIMKEGKHDVVVLDGISDLPRWAEQVVILELRKKDPTRKVIGDKDKASWAVRNNLAYLPLERLSIWAVSRERKVFLTTLMTDEYINDKRVGVVVDAKDRLLKATSVRICLSNDGRGRIAKFEKTPGWAEEGPAEVAVKKDGLAMELMKRGLL